MQSRQVPADEDAEQALLGSLLLACSHESNLLARIRRIVDSSCFYRDRHGWIFAAMLSIADKGCGGDIQVRNVHQITVRQQLGFEGKLKACGGAAYLSHLIANCATTVFAEDYARIVKDMADRRRQIGKARKMEADAYSPNKPSQAAKGGVYLIPME